MKERYLFVGNRFYVLEKMLTLGLDVGRIYAQKDSYLEAELKRRGISYLPLPGKAAFLQALGREDYDVLVSNGCPYILPISQLADGRRRFVNIHPSLLPDLKGRSPINGALLFGRRHGVTCHEINDEIDGGRVLAQMEIPLTEDMNLDLLYQMSFRLEGEVFERAWRAGFQPVDTPPQVAEPLYYTKTFEDRIVTVSGGPERLLAQVRAFGSQGQYALLPYGGAYREIRSATRIENECVRRYFERETAENRVYMAYGGRFVLLRLGGALLQLELESLEGLAPGTQVIDEA